MDWMATIGESWLTTLGWVAGLAAVFGLLARLTPCNPGMFWWKDRRAALTDFLYWFVVPLFLSVCRLLMLIGGVLLLFGGRDPDLLPVRDLPLWQQALAILLLEDVMLYWIHRAFHTRRAWKFHAVHHSPKVLDWTAAQRSHPVNYLLEFAAADVAVLLLGFSPAALLVLAPFNILYSSMVHANLNWTFGPFRYLLASPVFHRWHHTTQEEGLDKNFASTFPFLDLLFGTFYMPPERLPERYGTGDADFPQGFWGQFLHPFRRRKSGQPVPGPAGWAVPLAWARRRPAAALLAGGLVVASLAGAGGYFLHRLLGRTEQLAREVEQARAEQRRTEASRFGLQIDLALRALADNDLVRATGVLNQVAAPFRDTVERRRALDLCRSKCRPLTGHTTPVLSTAVSADGHTIAAGAQDGTVKVWDAETGQEKLTLKGHPRPVRGLAISADGTRIVTGSDDGTAKVWDAEGREKLTLKGHGAGVLSVAISASGNRILTGSADSTARVWDARTGQELWVLRPDAGAVPSVALGADGRRAVSAGWGTVKVWDARTGEQEAALKGHTDLVYSVAISPDGKQVVSGSFDQTVKLWDAAAGREEQTFKGHVGPVYCVAVSHDGRQVVSAGADGTVKVWDAATGRQELSLKGHADSVTSVTVGADGRHLVSGGHDGTVQVWDVRRCRQEPPPPPPDR